MPLHPLIHFEIQKYNQINDVYSINNLPKIRNGRYVINLDEFKSIETHGIALYVNSNNTIYFDSFGVQHISKEIKRFIGNKNITNIYRIQAYNWIINAYFRIGFIDFILKGNILMDYKIVFSPEEYEKNDKMILKYFQ